MMKINKATKVSISAIVLLLIALGNVFPYITRQNTINNLKTQITETKSHYKNVTPNVSKMDQGQINTLDISTEATSRYRNLIQKAFSGKQVDLNSEKYTSAFGAKGTKQLANYAYSPDPNLGNIPTARKNYQTQAYVSDINATESQMTISVLSEYQNRNKKNGYLYCSIVIGMERQNPIKVEIVNSDEGRG